ncbi:MAG TPA: selenide, water dikinase SelD [Spartobacteria bacterium]|jgi:selenide,water dikinase|nr:selenide, water dikinase SelD [Spartobacteria bacterium]
MQVLRQLPFVRDPRVIVGSAAADDAGVYRLDRSRALVQTVDFFTPIVDDPFQYGEIAAANALSDIFAMGGRPITALNIVGMPTEKISAKTIATILRGGLSKAREVDCAIIGGHTIRSPEPLYGLAVTGIVDLRHIMTNANARPGDLLLLTKPLGTGIVTTAIKRGSVSRSLKKKTIALMSRINIIGADLAHRGLVRAATDVTGFGLLGHLASMCRASGVSAEILADRVPVIADEVFDLIARDCIPGGSRDNLKTANRIADWRKTPQPQRILFTDAQTSGGLLLAVAPGRLNKVLALLKRNRTACAAIIGKIVSAREPLLCISE